MFHGIMIIFLDLMEKTTENKNLYHIPFSHLISFQSLHQIVLKT